MDVRRQGRSAEQPGAGQGRQQGKAAHGAARNAQHDVNPDHVLHMFPEGEIQAAAQHCHAQQRPTDFQHKLQQGAGRIHAFRQKKPYAAAHKQQPAQAHAQQPQLAGKFFVGGASACDRQNPGSGGQKAHTGKSQQGRQRQGHAKAAQSLARQGKGLQKRLQRLGNDSQRGRHVLQNVHEAPCICTDCAFCPNPARFGACAYRKARVRTTLR